MKVVIYGGSGFIGAWITKLLLVNNFQITIFDKKINEDLLSHIIGKNVEKIHIVEGDILEYENVLKTANLLECLAIPTVTHPPLTNHPCTHDLSNPPPDQECILREGGKVVFWYRAKYEPYFPYTLQNTSIFTTLLYMNAPLFSVNYR